MSALRRLAGRMATAAEERTLAGALASPAAPLWKAWHRSVSAPVKAAGRLRWWRGPERTLRIATVGPIKRFGPVLEALDATADPIPGRRTGTWAPEGLEGLSADVVLVDVHPWAERRYRDAGWHLIPSCVRWIGEAETLPRAGSDVKKARRLLREHGDELEAVPAGSDRATWRWFVRHMMDPYARARFGDDAWTPSRPFARFLARHAWLLFVRRGGRRVAGMAAVPAGRALWIVQRSIRTSPTDPEEHLRLLRASAAGSLELLMLEWARAEGFRHVDQGRTTAFVSTGLARFKAAWGYTPQPDPLAHLMAARLEVDSRAGRALAEAELLEDSDGVLRPFGLGALARASSALASSGAEAERPEGARA